MVRIYGQRDAPPHPRVPFHWIPRDSHSLDPSLCVATPTLQRTGRLARWPLASAPVRWSMFSPHRRWCR